MSERCKFCLQEGSGCGIIMELNSQAKTGMYKDPSLDESKGAGGPYWPRHSWNNYTENAITRSKDGCLRPDSVAALADKLTREKDERGELINVDPPPTGELLG